MKFTNSVGPGISGNIISRTDSTQPIAVKDIQHIFSFFMSFFINEVPNHPIMRLNSVTSNMFTLLPPHLLEYLPEDSRPLVLLY